MSTPEVASDVAVGEPRAKGDGGPTMIDCQIVDDGQRFDELKDAWQALWLRNKAGIFQSHHWIKAWWTSGQTEFRLHITVAWQAGELVGVLPLVIRHWCGARVLQWAAQPVSDYCDAVADSDAVLRQLWIKACSAGRFDIVRLKNVRRDAAIHPILCEAIAPAESGDVCLQVTNRWPDGERWFRDLNKKKRNNHSRGNRILLEMGKVSIRHLVAEPSPAVISRLSDLKEQWLRANGLASSCDAAMLSALVRALGSLGVLRMFLIECEGEVVAGSINAVQGDRLLAFFATYDPAAARASPGIMLMTHYIMWAFDNGITEVDFLRGEETYKFEFANTSVALDVFLTGRTIVGSSMLAAHRLWMVASQRFTGDRGAIQKPMIGSAYFTEKGTPRDASKAATGKAATGRRVRAN